MNKDEYFTEQTIVKQSRKFLKFVSNYHNRHSEQKFIPYRASLVVLDMQVYFLDPESHAYIPSARSILPGIQSLITAFSSIGQPIIFTRHVNTEINSGMMSKWWKDMIVPRSACSQIVDNLDTSNHLTIEKHQYDAFFETNLDTILRDSGVEQVVITGVMTHLCCETTARSAFMRGYEVFFPVDGTATYTETHHHASLLNLAHGFVLPLLVADIVSQFKS